jgi:hypothetical protein
MRNNIEFSNQCLNVLSKLTIAVFFYSEIATLFITIANQNI